MNALQNFLKYSKVIILYILIDLKGWLTFLVSQPFKIYFLVF